MHVAPHAQPMARSSALEPAVSVGKPCHESQTFRSQPSPTVFGADVLENFGRGQKMEVDAGHSDTEAIRQRIQDATSSQAKAPGSWSLMRRKASFWFQYSRGGFIVDAAVTCLSLLACIMYIVTTYMEEEGLRPWWIFAFEWVVFVVFASEYIFRAFIAESLLSRLLSRDAVIDLLSILPIITLHTDVPLGFLRILRVFRIIRILRGFRQRSSGSIEDVEAAVKQQLAVLVFVLASFLFVGAGLVHSVERIQHGTYEWLGGEDCDWDSLSGVPLEDLPKNCQFHYFYALYYVIITVTTVGYGEVVPSSNLGRVVILSILLPLFVIIPREVSKLTDLMERRPRFAKAMVASETPHVIVCGDFNNEVAVAFLSEFFHSDHGDQRMSVVFFSPWEPSALFSSMLMNPNVSKRVQYVRGSPFSSNDLYRVRLSHAHAVFVINTQFSDDIVRRDMTAVLMVKSIRTVHPSVPVFCQLVDPTMRSHCAWARWDHFVSVRELRLGTLAKNAVCPGFSTFLGNLIMSSGQASLRDVAAKERRWMEDYLHGYGQELYTIEFGSTFEGQLFCVAAHQIYCMFGICLLGVETEQKRTVPQGTDDASNDDGRAADDSDASESGSEGASESDVPLSAGQPRDQAAPRPRSEVLRDAYNAKLGHVNPASLDGAMERDRWQEERKERDNSILLLNPKNYCIRTRDKAILIAGDFGTARNVQLWNGRVPGHISYAMGVTPAHKATFGRLNNGRGPLLREIQPVRLFFFSSARMVPILSLFVDENLSLFTQRIMTAVEALGLASQENDFWTGSDGQHEKSSSSSSTSDEESHGRGTISERVSARGDNSISPRLPFRDDSPRNRPPAHQVASAAVGVRARDHTPPPPLLPTGVARRSDLGAPRVNGNHAVGGGARRRSRRMATDGSGRGGERSEQPPKQQQPFSSPGDQTGDDNREDDVDREMPWPGGFGSVEDARNLRGHIVVCGPVDDALLFLLERLRGESDIPVVVLHGDEMPALPAMSPRTARDVFFVEGSAVYVPDLERTGIVSASVAILLARLDVDGDNESSQERHVGVGAASDLEVVFTASIIEAQYPTCRTVVEILDPEAMRLMNYAPSCRTVPHGVWPQYASGRVFSDWALDTVIVQSYYNPSVISLVTRLAAGRRLEDDRNQPTHGGASSAAGSDGVEDEKASTHPFGATRTDIISLLGPGNAVTRVQENAELVPMRTPIPFTNRFYKDLFAELVLTQNILPVGLIRSNHVYGSLLPYVVTNPPPLTVLHPEDRIIVLCSSEFYRTSMG